MFVFDKVGSLVLEVEEGSSFGGYFEASEGKESLAEIASKCCLLEEEISHLLDMGV